MLHYSCKWIALRRRARRTDGLTKHSAWPRSALPRQNRNFGGRAIGKFATTIRIQQVLKRTSKRKLVYAIQSNLPTSAAASIAAPSHAVHLALNIRKPQKLAWKAGFIPGCPRSRAGPAATDTSGSASVDFEKRHLSVANADVDPRPT
jgi:hypothetical protein